MEKVEEKKIEQLEKAIEETKDQINAKTIETKKGLKAFMAFCRKLAKWLALPIGVVIGYFMKAILSRDSDDDETEPAGETTEE